TAPSTASNRAAPDDDVLAELGRELPAFLVELADRVGALALHGLEHLGGKGEELLVVRDRLGLAADGHDDAELGVVGDPVADFALGRLSAGPLGRARQTALSEERLRSFEVAVRVLQGALAIHHSGTSLVAKLLDERGRDLRHSERSVEASAGTGGEALPLATSSPALSCAPICSYVGSWETSSALGASVSSAVAGVSGSSTGAGVWGSSAGGAAISCGVTFALPALIASAIARITSEHERIASSLPGIT